MSISRFSVPPEVLKLPENFVLPEKREKRQAQPVDFSILTEEQMEVAQQVMDYVSDSKPKNKMLVIQGYAGTGKTFTFARIIEWLVYSQKKTVACTAPTNKAVQVSKEMSEFEHELLSYSTLHSLLGLKLTYDHYGRMKFIPDNANPPSLTGYDVLVVDETSMLNKELFQLILEHVHDGLKVIFVGDPAQIPPIQESDAIPFLNRERMKYKIGLASLTQVQRQATDSPILQYATAIRQQRNKPDFSFNYKVDIVNGSGIIPVLKSDKDLIYEICKTYFANSIFESYPDFFKVIAWRNNAVNAVNKKVRALIYKSEDIPALMPGEKLIADEPIMEGYTIVASTNQDLEVLDYDVVANRIEIWFKNTKVVNEVFKYYNARVRVMTEKGYRDNIIRIVHEDSLNQYNTKLESLKLRALDIKDRFKRLDAWKCFYQLKNFFAQVKYNYAITAHKAQGSTYENTMILEWDMLESDKYQEANRIRYVAATRPRKYLFIVNDRF